MRLLKLGVPWDFIHELSESQLNMVLGIEAALLQKENDDQDASAQKGQNIGSMMNLGGWR